MPFYFVYPNPADPPSHKPYTLRDPLTGTMHDLHTKPAVFGGLPASLVPPDWDGDARDCRDPHLRIKEISESEAHARGYVVPEKPWQSRQALAKARPRVDLQKLIDNGAKCPTCDKQLELTRTATVIGGSTKSAAPLVKRTAFTSQDLDEGRVIIVGVTGHPYPGKHSQTTCMMRCDVKEPAVPTPSPAALRKAVAIAAGQVDTLKGLVASAPAKEARSLTPSLESAKRLHRTLAEALAAGYVERARVWRIVEGEDTDEQVPGLVGRTSTGLRVIDAAIAAELDRRKIAADGAAKVSADAEALAAAKAEHEGQAPATKPADGDDETKPKRKTKGGAA